MYRLNRGLLHYSAVEAFLCDYWKTQGSKKPRLDITNAISAIDIIDNWSKRMEILDMRDLFEPPDLLAKAILELIFYAEHPVFASVLVNEKTKRAALLLVSDFSVDLKVRMRRHSVRLELLRSSLSIYRMSSDIDELIPLGPYSRAKYQAPKMPITMSLWPFLLSTDVRSHPPAESQTQLMPHMESRLRTVKGFLFPVWLTRTIITNARPRANSALKGKSSSVLSIL